MNPRVLTLLRAVLAVDVEHVRTDTPLALLGWDEATWLALRGHFAVEIQGPNWHEPSRIQTVGEFSDWIDSLEGKPT